MGDVRFLKQPYNVSAFIALSLSLFLSPLAVLAALFLFK
jgi:hypothetical protein